MCLKVSGVGCVLEESSIKHLKVYRFDKSFASFIV